jgi:hypothetical protein
MTAPRVSRAAFNLRTNLFKTSEREQTNRVVLTYTNHVPDPRIDAHYIDLTDAQRSYLGINAHYIVKLNGDIERGRDPHTKCTRSRQKNLIDNAIFIAVVGGRDAETGYRAATITGEQDASVEWLMQAISDSLGMPLEVSDFLETWRDSRSTASTRSRDQEFVDMVYAGMTPEELAASPDRLQF